MAQEEGGKCIRLPGLRACVYPPAVCRGISARSVGLRYPAIREDIYKTDAKVKELIADDAHLHHWLDMAKKRIHFQGLPARIYWVGLGDRAKLGFGIQ